jgi:serine/threonine protein kinase
MHFLDRSAATYLSDIGVKTFTETVCPHICCKLNNFSIAFGGFSFPVYSAVLVFLALLSIIFFLFKMRQSHTKHLPVYSNLLVLSAFSFLIIVMIRLIPLMTEGWWWYIGEAIHLFSLTVMWYIQFLIALFSFGKDSSFTVVRSTVLKSLVIVLFFSILWVLALFVGCAYCGPIITEILLFLFFLFCSIATFAPLRLDMPRPRSTAMPWFIYQALAHGIYSISYLLLLYDSSGYGVCFAIFANIVFYALYAPFLYWTLTRDSQWWRRNAPADSEKSAFLSTQGISLNWSGLADEADGAFVESVIQEQLRVCGLRKIARSDLVLKGKVGTGASGDVYVGIWNQTEVAIKQFRMSQTSGESFRALEALLRESELLARLRHPHVMQFFGVVVEAPFLETWMICEYLPNGSLFRALHYNSPLDSLVPSFAAATAASASGTPSEGTTDSSSSTGPDGSGDLAPSNESSQTSGKEKRDKEKELVTFNASGAGKSEKSKTPRPMLPICLVIRLALDIAKGMLFLHSCRPIVLHRDLKSQNILLDSDFHCKVCDFGISRAATTMNTMTAVGTPQWMSPEVLRNERYSEKADVYAYGVVLWELLTRTPPFKGLQAVTVVSLVGHQGQRPPMPLDAPFRYRQLIEQCWHEDPEVRPSFLEIVSELEDYAQELLQDGGKKQ